jgi:hypothetical protein
MQGRLIVLELYDQMGVRDGGGFECFFVTAQVRLDSFRQTTVQNFLDSGF